MYKDSLSFCSAGALTADRKWSLYTGHWNPPEMLSWIDKWSSHVKKLAIIEHCFATQHCLQNLVCRLETRGGKKRQPEAHKSQRSIPEEGDLLCGAAVSCFARSWSVKYSEGQIQPIVGYSSVEFVMGVQRLSFLEFKMCCLLDTWHWFDAMIKQWKGEGRTEISLRTEGKRFKRACGHDSSFCTMVLKK